jgi:hypothetical protein
MLSDQALLVLLLVDLHHSPSTARIAPLLVAGKKRRWSMRPPLSRIWFEEADLVLPGLLPVRPLVFLAQPDGRRVLQAGG